MPEVRGVPHMDEFTETRMWRALDAISDKLKNIDDKLSDIVRLEEKINSHEKFIDKADIKIDIHEEKLQQMDVWRAGTFDKGTIENHLKSIHKDIESIRSRVTDIENKNFITRGHKDIGKEALKWISVILAGTVTFLVTKGIGV